MVVNKIQKNIGFLFILNFKLNNFKKFYLDKCNILRCLSCKFTVKKLYLKYKKLPFMSDSNFELIGIFYIIKCKKI